MNKTTIEVPAGIRYISQWQGFSLPDYPHILDKKIPGCGFTEWAITNDEDVVLICPRRTLLGNKAEQHPGEVYYVINNFEEVADIGKDLSRNNRYLLEEKVISEEERKEYFRKLTASIMKYVGERHSKGLPAKILVTYDSFHLIYSILLYHNILQDYRLVVDEFQSIFVDSRFKSTTEMKFMNYLSNCNKVCYVSATPMIEEYLDQMDEFKNLPYYELDWNSLQPGRIIKPELKILKSKAVLTSAKAIIEPYKEGKFDYSVDQNTGNVVYSKEAVIYVNSVNNIINIIKKCSLVPDEVNILCANTDANSKKIRRKLGKGFTIGRVPLRGEQHKMFTVCTRTVYLGSDFYSTNAKTFIISDANLDTLAVDISLDLPQILGRQRLDINPWKNKATFYYKPLAEGKVLSKEDFDNRVKSKLKYTEDVLISFNSTPVGNRGGIVFSSDRLAKLDNYRINYVAVDNVYDDTGKVINKEPVENKLVVLAEQRAYDIQQIDYKDRFSVFNTLNRVILDKNGNQKKTEEFFKEYLVISTMYHKLKYLCEYPFDNEEFKNIVLNNLTEKHFKEYYIIVGPEECRALGYNITEINKRIGLIAFNKDLLKVEIYSQFMEGSKYTRAYIKETLSTIYEKVGYDKKAKANDIEDWFETSVVLISQPGSNKRIPGYKLIKQLK